jgi:capsid protein
MDHLRINQARGVPYLAPVIEALKQLDRYTESEIMAAVVNSFFAVFIKSKLGRRGDRSPGHG